MSVQIIRVTPGQLTDSLALRSASALEFSTTLDSDDAGVFFARNYPTLSSGEELLWQVLAWLNGQANLPDDADLRAGLDSANYTAAMAAVGASL